jgi:hypothetical protein
MNPPERHERGQTIVIKTPEPLQPAVKDYKGNTRYELYQCGSKPMGRKLKINAILDDASNETFFNEEVAGVLGIQEPFEKVKVHVLNDAIETFQSMPVTVMIESVDGQFSKEVKVRTCPRNVTGNYSVKDWSAHQSQWSHLNSCSFPKPAGDMLIGLINKC